MHLRLSRVTESSPGCSDQLRCGPGARDGRRMIRVSWAGFSAAVHHRRARARRLPGRRVGIPTADLRNASAGGGQPGDAVRADDGLELRRLDPERP